MRILGIDYGLKRIGLAMSDSGLAEPLKVINWSDEATVIKEISRLCQKYAIQKIVIGLPEGKIAFQVKKWGKRLSRESRLSIVFQDETLTSQEAIVKMIEAGRGQKARREKKDAVAAALILQKHLDKLNV